ncbi:MAG: rhamnogalacturonan acetylesterase [Gemmatimonadaceae bacterium]
MRRRIAPLVLVLLLAAFAWARRPVTIFIAGDSTAAPKLETKRPETGWGEALPKFFRADRVRVVNLAMNGRSTRTFISEGRWQALVDSLHAGDWVFIQFGHNDESKEKVDRYTPPADFRANLARFVGDVRARKGRPVLLTPVRRRKFDAEGRLVDTHGEYPDLVRAVARELRVPLLDMHQETGALLERFGPDSSAALFLHVPKGASPNYPEGVQDNTHFNPRGADLVARLVVRAIREQRLGLAKHLTGEGKRAGAELPRAGRPAVSGASPRR